MKYPFNTSEQLIYEFEQLLKEHDLIIQKNSDLERISLQVLETNAKFKKEIKHDDKTDIRLLFSDIAGLIDLIEKIIKNRHHKDFDTLIPHLILLNKANTAVLTTKSKITDGSNNKLMELYIALLCMRFAKDITLDDPNNAKGDNPDVMFTYCNKKWAIACKALHSVNVKTLYDTIEKGTKQIDVSNAEKGLVIVNFKNVIDQNELWPIINIKEFEDGEEPIFTVHQSLDEPYRIIKSYGSTYQKRLIELIGQENLISLSKNGKCTNGFLIFLHAITSVMHEGRAPATILKTFNLVEFYDINNEYKKLVNDLNQAMHNII